MDSTKSSLELFVAQKEIRLGLLELLDVERNDQDMPIPETVFVPKVDWFRMFSKEEIFSQAAKDERQRLVPNEDEITRWGLRNGDCVVLGPGSKILSVNGQDSPEIVATRPKIVGVGGITSDYANRRLPVEKHGHTDVKVFTLRAPIGKGHRLFIAAPPNTGKTWLIRHVFESCLSLTEEDEKLYIIGLQVGERAEDAKAMMDILERTPHDDSRCEFYQSPDGDPEEANFYLTQYVVDRARRLCESGYDVVLFVDSFSRVLISHSRAAGIKKPPDAGLISKGLSNASASAVKKLLAVAGDFEGAGSLTIVATMLKEGFGRSSSAEVVLFDETGTSTSTAIWALTNHFDIKEHPKIDVNLTSSREHHRICSSDHLAEMKRVEKYIHEGGKDFSMIHGRLVWWAKNKA